jgi:hypothetical protein
MEGIVHLYRDIKLTQIVSVNFNNVNYYVEEDATVHTEKTYSVNKITIYFTWWGQLELFKQKSDYPLHVG